MLSLDSLPDLLHHEHSRDGNGQDSIDTSGKCQRMLGHGSSPIEDLIKQDSKAHAGEKAKNDESTPCPKERLEAVGMPKATPDKGGHDGTCTRSSQGQCRLVEDSV